MHISVCGADLGYCVMFSIFVISYCQKRGGRIDTHPIWNASENLGLGEGASFSCDLSLTCCSRNENTSAHIRRKGKISKIELAEFVWYI